MKAKNRKSNSQNQPLLFRALRMVACLCVLLATGALAGCQFMKPVDGPGMEREVNDSLDSEKGDSVIAETSAGTTAATPSIASIRSTGNSCAGREEKSESEMTIGEPKLQTTEQNRLR